MPRTVIHSSSQTRATQEEMRAAAQRSAVAAATTQRAPAPAPAQRAPAPARRSGPPSEALEPISTTSLSLSDPAISLSAPPPVEIHPLRLGSPLDQALVMHNAPDSKHAALYRMLRRRLVERLQGTTVMVTSAERGVGKTTCAINLAMALSEGGRARVLLLEAHLRAPTVAQRLRTSPPECFATQLAAVRENEDRVWRVGSAGSAWLHLLAVSPTSAASGQPLNRALLKSAMAQLKRVGYDFIVIDAPPVLGTADTMLLEDFVDGVVVATRARCSKTTSLRSALEQLTPKKILGVALLDA